LPAGLDIRSFRGGAFDSTPPVTGVFVTTCLALAAPSVLAAAVAILVKVFGKVLPCFELLARAAAHAPFAAVLLCQLSQPVSCPVRDLFKPRIVAGHGHRVCELLLLRALIRSLLRRLCHRFLRLEMLE